VKLDSELHTIPIGKGEIVKQGEDIAILAIGNMVVPALEVAQELASSSIEATVVNARFVKPLDSDLLVELAGRIKRIVTVEENTLSGGFGSSVVNFLQKVGVSDIQVRSIGLPDEFIEQGTQTILRSKYALDVKGIVGQILTSFPNLKTDSLIQVNDEAKVSPF
jgi:1-deoxy-D-xylulose-5-phosphate synthase